MYVSLIVLGIAVYSSPTSHAAINGADQLPSGNRFASLAAESPNAGVLFCSFPGGGQLDEHTSDFGQIQVQRFPPVILRVTESYALEFART
jgi:hypothetical protein